jgi:tetratricopeptide (TPR) repeat protein
VQWNIPAQKSSLDDAATAASWELEMWIRKIDTEEVNRLAKQNELESFIYQVKGWLSGPDRALLKPEVMEPAVESLSQWFEDAQYEENTTYAMYDERLGGLKRQLEEHGEEYYAKKRKEKAPKDKMRDEQAEIERQRRKDAVMDDDKDDRKMAKSERLKLAMKNKEEGNVVFKAGNLEDAAGRYQRSMQHLNKYFMLDCSPEEKDEANAVVLSVNLNLAQVWLKLATQTEKDSGKDKAEAVYQKAKAACDEALKVDAENVKAKFRKATAMVSLGDIDGAGKEVKSALKADPENADLGKLKDRIDKLQAAALAKQKKVYGKMFG